LAHRDRRRVTSASEGATERAHAGLGTRGQELEISRSSEVPAERRFIRQAGDHAPWLDLDGQRALSAYWIAVEHGMRGPGSEVVNHENGIVA